MAFFKFSAVICALFVLQAQAYPQHETAVGGVVDIVREVVTQLETAVNQSLDTGIYVLDKAITWVKSLPDKEKEAVSKLVDSIGDIIDKQLEKLAAVVNDDAKAILACVDKNKAEWRTARVDLVYNLANCTATSLPELLEAAKAIIVDIKTLQAEVEATASSGIDKCDDKSEIEALGCLADVAKDVVEVAKKAPDAIRGGVEKLIDIYRKDKDVVRKCAKASVQDYITNGIIKSINDLATCARTS